MQRDRGCRKRCASAGVASGVEIPTKRMRFMDTEDMEIDFYPAYLEGVIEDLEQLVIEDHGSVHPASGNLPNLPFRNGLPTAGTSSSGGNGLPRIGVQLPGQATSGTSAPGLPAWPHLVAVQQIDEPEDMDVD